MQVLVHFLYLLGTNAFVYMPFASLVLVAVVFIPGLRQRRWLVALAIGNMVLAFLNVFLGSTLATQLVYYLGTTGQAEVVSSYGTNTQDNSHDVQGYRVLLRTAQGQTVETSFEDDEFNVYPTRNSTSYPGVGDVFTACYLPAYPQDFVIISNDASP